jgi:hypothetical protein
MFEIHGWGYAVYVVALAVSFGCGYYWRISEERRRPPQQAPSNVLTEEEWERFTHAMLHPKPPTRSMRDAIEVYDKRLADKTALNPKNRTEFLSVFQQRSRMNYFAFCLFFTLAGFVNLILALNSDAPFAVMPWWAHAALGVACTGAAIHAGYWERRTRHRAP